MERNQVEMYSLRGRWPCVMLSASCGCGDGKCCCLTRPFQPHSTSLHLWPQTPMRHFPPHKCCSLHLEDCQQAVRTKQNKTHYRYAHFQDTAARRLLCPPLVKVVSQQEVRMLCCQHPDKGEFFSTSRRHQMAKDMGGWRVTLATTNLSAGLVRDSGVRGVHQKNVNSHH